MKKEIRRGEHQKMQKSGLAGRVSLWLANGGACAIQHFSSKWVLALSYKDTRDGKKLNWSPERAAFSLVLRSKNQMFSGGRKELWAAAGCAFLVFTAIGGFGIIASGTNSVVVFFVCRL